MARNEAETEPAGSLVLVETWRSRVADLVAATGGVGRPLVELGPPASDGETLPHRVGDWVDHYRRALSRSPAEPPFAFAGWSFGGVLALELARALHAEGADVRWVGLIDAIRPLRLREALAHLLFLETAGLDVPARRGLLVREARRRARRRRRLDLAPVLRTLGFGGEWIVPPMAGAEPAREGGAVEEITRATYRAYLHYRARPVELPVTVFATDWSVRRVAGDPSLRWSPVLRGGFSVVRLPGDHYSLWEPSQLDRLVASIAGELRSA